MAWGIVMITCYFVAAMGLLIMGLAADAKRVPAERIDVQDLPTQIPDSTKKAA